jgi:hypothetical protein
MNWPKQKPLADLEVQTVSDWETVQNSLYVIKSNASFK